MPDSFDYTTGTNSENVRLLQALIDDAPEYTEETNSRNANILKSIINNTEYTDAPQSEIEELLLRLKAKIGGEIEVDELTVTENGIYDAGVNKAYNPVNVELPLSSKTITENGTYTASDDNLAGYNEVTVAVEGYAKKSIANTPTAIATFNASALPMPSLKVSIEAVQSGTGDPSPTNIRPISGWSAVNRYRTGNNLIGFKDGTGAAGTNRTYTISNNTVSVTSSSNVVSSQILVGTALSGVLDINLFKAGTYKLSISNQTGFTETIQFVFKYSDNTNITVNDGDTFTLISDATLVSIVFSTSVSWNTKTLSFNAQVERGEEATTYEAYSGTTYTTQLKDSQGNPLECYGGELSNVNGVQSLVNDHEKNSPIGSDVMVTDVDGYAIVRLGDMGYVDGEKWAMCNMLKKWDGQASAIPVGYFKVFNSPAFNRAQFIFKLDYSSETLQEQIQKYANFLDSMVTAGTPLEVIYGFATPQTIPQDNLAISTQEGTNNLWADSGDIQSGEYMEAL